MKTPVWVKHLELTWHVVRGHDMLMVHDGSTRVTDYFCECESRWKIKWRKRAKDL